MTNVMICIKGKNEVDEVAEPVEMYAEGKLYKKGNAYYLRYDETEVTGMEGTTTTIKIIENCIHMVRKGTVNSHMIFENGKRSKSFYDTFYGVFMLEIYTTEVSSDFNENGGNLELKYRINIDNQSSCENFFNIHVRPIV